jgi:transposase
MATTSFLYHSMGVKGYRYVRCEYDGATIRHHVRLRRHRRRCRGCDARWQHLVLDGQFERVFVSLPIGKRRQEVVLHGQIQQCRRCGRRLREPIPFAEGGRRYIRAVASYVVYLCDKATIKDVADIVGLGWDSVKEIFKNHLRRQLQKRSLSNVRRIAVDEFAVRKGYHYLTVVLDLDSGQVLWSAEGRSADSLSPFLDRLKRCRAPLEAVAVDMWPAYTLAIRSVFPKVAIVYDPFHIVKLVNKAIDNAQRELAAQIPKTIRHRRGLRFVLLRARETLGLKGTLLLRELMRINQPLYQAYLLKEQLRQLWRLPRAASAALFLARWIDQAMATGLRSFRQLANTLQIHADAILAWYAYRISTGPLEGLNNKIKTLKRQAYGFRDMEYFQLRLAFIHSAIPRFPG